MLTNAFYADAMSENDFTSGNYEGFKKRLRMMFNNIPPHRIVRILQKKYFIPIRKVHDNKYRISPIHGTERFIYVSKF